METLTGIQTFEESIRIAKQNDRSSHINEAKSSRIRELIKRKKGKIRIILGADMFACNTMTRVDFRPLGLLSGCAIGGPDRI